MSKKRQIIFCDAFCVEIGHESSERHQKSISFDNENIFTHPLYFGG